MQLNNLTTFKERRAHNSLQWHCLWEKGLRSLDFAGIKHGTSKDGNKYILFFSDDRQTAAGYVQTLQRATIMTEGPRLCGNSWVFQQDNAAVHNARMAKDFFRENSTTARTSPSFKSYREHLMDGKGSSEKWPDS